MMCVDVAQALQHILGLHDLVGREPVSLPRAIPVWRGSSSATLC